MDIIGVDPGPITGIARLRLYLLADGEPELREVDAIQVTHGIVLSVLDGIIPQNYGRTVVAMEQFVVGTRAARSATPAGGAAARRVIELVRDWACEPGITLVERRAADVKPWATDQRLLRAGLLLPTKGMQHARDAARHALFCAVRDFGLPDPLSTRAGAR